MSESAKKGSETPQSSDIPAEQFFEVDMRVGTVLSADPFPQARKPAFRLRIDFGPLGTKHSSAQLTERYHSDELVGSQVIAVVNIGSRNIAGFTSECLVLGVNDESGAVVHLTPHAQVPNGQRVY